MPICGAALPDIPVGGGAAVAAPAPGLVGVPPLALLLVPARALRALGRAPLRPLGGDAGQPRALLLLVTVQALNTNLSFSHLVMVLPALTLFTAMLAVVESSPLAD